MGRLVPRHAAAVLLALGIAASCGTGGDTDTANTRTGSQTTDVAEIDVDGLEDLAAALQTVHHGEVAYHLEDLKAEAAESAVVGIGHVANITDGPSIDLGELADGSPSLAPYLAIEIEADNLVKGADLVGGDPIRVLYEWSDSYAFTSDGLASLRGAGAIALFLTPADFPSDTELVGPYSSAESRSTLFFAHPASVLVHPTGSASAFPLMYDVPPPATEENLEYLDRLGMTVQRLTSVDPEVQPVIPEGGEGTADRLATAATP